MASRRWHLRKLAIPPRVAPSPSSPWKMLFLRQRPTRDSPKRGKVERAESTEVLIDGLSDDGSWAHLADGFTLRGWLPLLSPSGQPLFDPVPKNASTPRAVVAPRPSAILEAATVRIQARLRGALERARATLRQNQEEGEGGRIGPGPDGQRRPHDPLANITAQEEQWSKRPSSLPSAGHLFDGFKRRVSDNKVSLESALEEDAAAAPTIDEDESEDDEEDASQQETKTGGAGDAAGPGRLLAKAVSEAVDSQLAPELAEKAQAKRKVLDRQISKVVLGELVVCLISIILSIVLVERGWDAQSSSYVTGPVYFEQPCLGLCSVLFSYLLQREYHLGARNRRPNPCARFSWWRVEGVPLFLVELVACYTTSYPGTSPVLAVFSFTRTAHLFKGLRFLGRNKQVRSWTISAGEPPDQSAMNCVKALVRDSPWLAVALLTAVSVPVLSYLILAVERWGHPLDNDGDELGQDMVDTLWTVFFMVTILASYTPSKMAEYAFVSRIVAMYVQVTMCGMSCNIFT